MGVNHFPVITELDIDGRDGFEMVAELVDELGGLDALAPKPGQEEAEPFSKLDFARRHLLKLTLLDRWGALLGANDRHLAEFVPSVLTEESGWGASWGIELTPMARRERSIRPSSWPRSTRCWPARRSSRPGTRASWWRRSSTRSSPAPAASFPLNRPNTGQCPDLPDDAVVESICVVDGDGIRGRDVAPRAGAVRRARCAVTSPSRR